MSCSMDSTAKKRQLKQGSMQELLTGRRRLPGFSGEWEEKPLGELADVRGGGTPSTSQAQLWDGGVPWCTPTDVTALSGFKYLTSTARTISQQGLSGSSAELIPANSVLMTSRATIGECAINLVPVSTNQGFKNFVPREAVDVEFFYYLLLTQKQGFIKLSAGSTFLEIGKRQLVGYEVRLPATRTEQAAIANVLSDIDAAIVSIEQLIAKKRQLKQGAMQELLTGRRRLPGFSEEWGIASLDSVVDRITGYWGSNESSPDSFNRAEVIRAGDISPDGQLIDTAPRFMSAAEFSRAQCRVDDTVITVSGNGLGKVWWCDGRPDVAASNFVRILRPKRNRASGRYLAYVLRSDSGLRKLHDHTATSAYPNLKPSFFAERWMLWPSIHEQEAIAALLSDIDDEMAAVETKLAKARSVKEGMMQELLTGKIRLG